MAIRRAKIAGLLILGSCAALSFAAASWGWNDAQARQAACDAGHYACQEMDGAGLLIAAMALPIALLASGAAIYLAFDLLRGFRRKKAQSRTDGVA